MKLCTKYQIAKADGSEVDSDAKYFVLRYDRKTSDRHAPEALLLYAYLSGFSELEEDVLRELQGDIPILPCPFCLNEASVDTRIPNGDIFAVSCSVCECYGPQDRVRERAVRLWNDAYKNRFSD
jgi:hypothetical protein